MNKNKWENTNVQVTQLTRSTRLTLVLWPPVLRHVTYWKVLYFLFLTFFDHKLFLLRPFLTNDSVGTINLYGFNQRGTVGNALNTVPGHIPLWDEVVVFQKLNLIRDCLPTQTLLCGILFDIKRWCRCWHDTNHPPFGSLSSLAGIPDTQKPWSWEGCFPHHTH